MRDSLAARKKAEVWGKPIAHSLSPLLHNTAYSLLGFDADYGTREVDGDALPGEVESLDEAFVGVSLTMPLKEAIVPLVPTHRGAVDRLGAANTIQRTSEGLVLWNTDPRGVVGALRDSEIHHVESVLIVGAGATARSVIAGVSDLGVTQVTVASRSQERAGPTINFAAAQGLEVRWVDLDPDPNIQAPDLVASTLPHGVEAPDWIGKEMVHHSALFDVAYHPWPSALATRFGSGNKPIASGLSMLVHQAVAQIRIFYSGNPDQALPDEKSIVGAMKTAVGLSAV